MKDGIFLSPEHHQRWLSVMQTLRKVDRGGFDLEYGAAIFILAGHSETWEAVSRYVRYDGIDFALMLKRVHFSGGYSVLILLAANLFNSRRHIDPVEFMRLDEENFELAMNAIRLRRYGLQSAA